MEKISTERKGGIDGSYAVKTEALDSDPSGNEFESKIDNLHGTKTCILMYDSWFYAGETI